MQELLACLVLNMCILLVKCGDDCRECHVRTNENRTIGLLSLLSANNYYVNESNHVIMVNGISKAIRNLIPSSTQVGNQNNAFPNLNETSTSRALKPNLDLKFELASTSLSVPLQDKNEEETYRSIMDKAKKTSSTMLSYMLVPALTLSGIIPWILPVIKMAASFAQIINQVAFTAGLVALVRNYVFDAKPDEHIVYVNHGYDDHRPMQ